MLFSSCEKIFRKNFVLMLGLSQHCTVRQKRTVGGIIQPILDFNVKINLHACFTVLFCAVWYISSKQEVIVQRKKFYFHNVHELLCSAEMKKTLLLCGALHHCVLKQKKLPSWLHRETRTRKTNFVFGCVVVVVENFIKIQKILQEGGEYV